MTVPQMRILIVGGYGVFGGRLAKLLAGEARCTLLIAGRSLEKAQAFVYGKAGTATLVATRFDRDGNLAAQLAALKPDIIVDASGPFQDYGEAPYKLVSAAIAAGVNYLDLADGSGFVDGVGQFDSAAKARGVFVLSGVSSFPVLTSAAVSELARGFAAIDHISAGVAPSPYAGVGENVIRAIASYAGKPVSLIRDGRPAVAYGLAETRRVTIAPPGHLPLRSTLFSLVDVPDLRVLPKNIPGLKLIWMGAGPVPEIWHRGLAILANGVRLRILPPLTPLAPLFHWVINHVRWGEHRGGMFVSVAGRTATGESVTRSWHMIADGDAGPLIPSMAAEALIRNCLGDRSPASGARSAANALTLADYAPSFIARGIVTGIREDSAEMCPAPLYKRVLGSAFGSLPPLIQDMHTVSSRRIAEGRAEVERGTNIVSRMIGAVFGFPNAASDVPVTVRFTVANGTETWMRTFGNQSFSSVQSQGRGRADKLIEERFGPFSFALAVVTTPERLSLFVRRWTVFGLPLPLALAPVGDAFEVVEDGRFCFYVAITLPVIGLLVRYRGFLEPRAEDNA